MTNPIKVLFDHQIFERQNTGGISRYFTELFTEWGNQDSVDFRLSIQYTDNIYLEELFLKGIISSHLQRLHDTDLRYLPSMKKIHPEIHRMIFDYLYFKKENRRKLSNQKATVELLKAKDFDVFHPTFFNDYFLPYLNDCPYVLTVYDLIEEIFPEYFMASGLDITGKRNVIQNASHIIAISEHTKKDIINIYNISPDKISTVYLGYRQKEIFNQEVPCIPERFFLYIGHRHLYKNFYFTLEALQSVFEKYPDIAVLCVGGPKFSGKEEYFFSSLHMENRIFWIDATDQMLIYCYRHAIALLYTSMYEGFGIPIVEAFFEGCPVIGTDVSSIPEVGGDAIAYVQPKDLPAIRKAAIRLISDLEYRNDLIEKGKMIAPFYSWTITARQTMEVYKKVLI